MPADLGRDSLSMNAVAVAISESGPLAIVRVVCDDTCLHLLINRSDAENIHRVAERINTELTITERTVGAYQDKRGAAWDRLWQGLEKPTDPTELCHSPAVFKAMLRHQCIPYIPIPTVEANLHW